jgi:radical SAM superfamily enzyme YgiQ (UPF0313 family)
MESRFVSLTGVRTRPAHEHVRVLLIGPYDPKGGEYTFLAPPLGVWRLAGALTHAGIYADVFDPNCCDDAPERELREQLTSQPWEMVGISTTGMTLPYDLALAHLVKTVLPDVLLVAGGMEATFNPSRLLALAPFDAVVLGEGEEPLLDLVARLHTGEDLTGIPGTAWPDGRGGIARASRPALGREALRDAIFQTPYDLMPYQRYWLRLEERYRVGGLPVKAEREARLAEIRSVRLITLNYCPMGCTFCSSTNFLNEAQGGPTARVARLDPDECLAMLRRIVRAHPTVRTIVFQDDIFVFTNDSRVLPLCNAIVAAKARGDLPAALQFISTNRVDAMTVERLTAMARAGFRVLGFGIESFSRDILAEFNKAQIHPHITPMLNAALAAGITPFLDMILTSPRCRLEHLVDNLQQAYAWILAGCEVGMYPYIIPFSGAAMAQDASLLPHTIFERREIAGTAISWDQPCKILPVDPVVRDAILRIEDDVERYLARLAGLDAHLPSRVRSLVWILCATPVLQQAGFDMPPRQAVERALLARLPAPDPDRRRRSRPAPPPVVQTAALRRAR